MLSITAYKNLKVVENPVSVLINFVDSAGVIGFVVAKKLYKDFADNKERAEGFSKTFEDGEIWLQNYNNWMIAFEFASENGAVSFC